MTVLCRHRFVIGPGSSWAGGCAHEQCPQGLNPGGGDTGDRGGADQRRSGCLAGVQSHGGERRGRGPWLRQGVDGRQPEAQRPDGRREPQLLQDHHSAGGPGRPSQVVQDQPRLRSPADSGGTGCRRSADRDRHLLRPKGRPLLRSSAFAGSQGRHSDRRPRSLAQAGLQGHARTGHRRTVLLRAAH